MGQLDEMWEWLPLRVMRRDISSLELGGVMKGYIYRNWRGNHFLIDEEYAKRYREGMREEGMDASEIDSTTPETLVMELPLHEEEDRMCQLEEMWERPVNPNIKKASTARGNDDRLP